MRRICDRLAREYGQPRFGNPHDPLDDLVYIVLSNRTAPSAAARTYALLKERYANWDSLLLAPLHVLRSALRPIGLSKIRSTYIHAMLRRIRDDIGSCDLKPLRAESETAAQTYLMSLPGVSEKVAKCVMLYTLGAQVLPVDVHVYRVALRLGWIDRKRADQCHRELESLVPKGRRYAFHVDCIAHGRAICRSQRPDCDNCVIKRDCQYYKKMLRTVSWQDR